ncbi:MAG: hypothetical protein NUW37_06110 [Planctomycetes bacterium]|nr:hypothetical protein [Planctomycetota bacterium]
MGTPFEHKTFLVRKQFWKIFGQTFRIFDEDQKLLFYVKQKAFKLKEDIRVYADEGQTDEVLTIKARSILDFGATYDVFDPVNDEVVGSLRRKGLASILRDSWLIFNEKEEEIGTILEDSMGMALLRRFLSNLIPQSFRIEVHGSEAATFKQHFNPFLFKGSLLMHDHESDLDPRIAIAAVVLLMAIEGRQQ